MSQAARYYVRSGRVGPRAPLYVIVAGGLCTAIFAAIYAVVIRYNPLVYFSFIGTLVFGGLTGFAAVEAAHAGRSRSRAFDLLAAFVLMLFGLWVYWLIWVMLEFDHGGAIAAKLAVSGPSTWLDFLQRLAENYHIGLSRRPGSHAAEASTGQMQSIWVGEALLVMAAALLMAWVSSGTGVYSERTGKWAARTFKGELDGVDATPEELRAAFERGDLSALHGLDAADANAHRNDAAWKSLDVELLAEPNDDALRVLNVTAIDNGWTSKGKRKQRSTEVVKYLILSVADYDALLARLNLAARTEPLADARDAGMQRS